MNPTNQLAFFDIIIIPLARAFHDVFPLSQPLLDMLLASHDFWQQRACSGQPVIIKSVEEYRRDIIDSGDNLNGESLPSRAARKSKRRTSLSTGT
jgi:hypothetical protein